MTQSIDLSTFRDVDTAPDPTGLIRFLDGVKHQPTLAELEGRLVDQLRLGPGMHVLDAGCGPGTQTLALASAAEGMMAAGVDASHIMIDEAARRARESGLDVTFEVADVAALPYPDASFDAVMAQTLFEHVSDPVAVTTELRRVTRPGGRMAALSIDTGSAILDHPDPWTSSTIINTWADGFASGGRVGRALDRLFRSAGLVDVSVEIRAAPFPAAFFRLLLTPTTQQMLREGSLDEARLNDWWAAFREREEGEALVNVSLWFLVAGTAPG
jgi:SAM-dependent methyltransferase